jgi:hypothetical protein
MRLIIPIILIALLLPYAISEDEPTGEWLVPPNPAMGVAVVPAGVPAVEDDAGAARPPATQPVAMASVARRRAW